jgi:hypothetical protein
MLEDFFLTDPADTKNLEIAYNYFQENDLNCLKLIPNFSKFDYAIVKDKINEIEFIQIQKNTPFIISTQHAIF